MSAGPATSPAPTTAALTPASPYGARLRAYLAERFPLLGHGLLIVSYCSSNQFLARRLTAPDGPMRYDWHSLAAGAVILCFFFHLRVFDEHKDYAEDCRFHPERLLQRGVFTLGELRILGLGAIVVQAVIATLSGAGALVAWLLAFGWSLLMLREFFVSAWLKAHFLLYTMSHMLVMPLLALLVYSLATGRPPWTAPAWFWLYSFVGFFVTLNWEISRKIRAPADEIAGLTTYSTIFGTYGAAWAVIVVRVIDTGMVAQGQVNDHRTDGGFQWDDQAWIFQRGDGRAPANDDGRRGNVGFVTGLGQFHAGAPGDDIAQFGDAALGKFVEGVDLFAHQHGGELGGGFLGHSE